MQTILYVRISKIVLTGSFRKFNRVRKLETELHYCFENVITNRYGNGDGTVNF